MFKRSKVVMLPTNEKATEIGMYKDTKRLVYNQRGKDIPRGEMQHLYILSDDEIKTGDWYITLTNDICKCGNKTNFTPKGKKLIATTDESLSLPKPSQAFIEKYVKKYNEGKPITDVLVEYEKLALYGTVLLPCSPHNNESNSDMSIYSDYLKVSSDNTITIKKVKDSWNRDEVETLLYEVISLWRHPHDSALYKSKDYLGKWIEKNL
jgi:hypothetical protein